MAKTRKKSAQSAKLSLKKLAGRVSELEDKWRRAVADYENLEKRFAKEKQVFVKLANARLVDKLLPALDDLRICQHHLKDEGLKMALDKTIQALESEGITEIKAVGEPFDPAAMDAVELVAGPKDEVVEVVVKGYRLEDQILRPARVKVGKGRKK